MTILTTFKDDCSQNSLFEKYGDGPCVLLISKSHSCNQTLIKINYVATSNQEKGASSPVIAEAIGFFTKFFCSGTKTIV